LSFIKANPDIYKTLEAMFVSTAHSKEDLDKIIQSIKKFMS